MKPTLNTVLIAVLVTLIPVFVTVTIYSSTRCSAAVETACTAQHQLEVHAAEQQGDFKVILQRLISIDAKLERHGELLEKVQGGS